jgi:hypothetical protein
MDVSAVMSHSIAVFNTVMLGSIGFLVKHALDDIKARIVRLEDRAMRKDSHV